MGELQQNLFQQRQVSQYIRLSYCSRLISMIHVVERNDKLSYKAFSSLEFLSYSNPVAYEVLGRYDYRKEIFTALL